MIHVKYLALLFLNIKKYISQDISIAAVIIFVQSFALIG